MCIKYIKLGQTPLSIAAGRGHLESVKVLLTHGADVNAADKVSHNTIYAPFI